MLSFLQNFHVEKVSLRQLNKILIAVVNNLIKLFQQTMYFSHFYTSHAKSHECRRPHVLSNFHFYKGTIFIVMHCMLSVLWLKCMATLHNIFFCSYYCVQKKEPSAQCIFQAIHITSEVCYFQDHFVNIYLKEVRLRFTSHITRKCIDPAVSMRAMSKFTWKDIYPPNEYQILLDALLAYEAYSRFTVFPVRDKSANNVVNLNIAAHCSQWNLAKGEYSFCYVHRLFQLYKFLNVKQIIVHGCKYSG